MRTAGNLLSLSLSLVLFAVSPLLAQASANGAGAAFAARTLAVLDPGGVPLTSIRLTGTATRTAGSDTATGSVTLEASGDGASRVELDLESGRRLEAHRRAAGAPRAEDEAGGQVRKRAAGDSWAPAAWFLPQFALAAVGSDGLVASAAAPAHLRLSRQVKSATKGMAAEIAQLSQADLYLDPATSLPLRLDFDRHPTGTVQFAEPVEIRYSGWREYAGIEVPAHVERWVNGVRRLAIDITGAEVNPGISADRFDLGSGLGGAQ